MSALGPTPLIHPAARIGLQHFLEAHPWAYQDEMLYYLFDDWGITVALSTLSNALKVLKIDRKYLKREALERSQECRELYGLDFSQFTHEMLVFLDETTHRRRS